jgi:superfamily II DNA or RNA helicase
MVLRITDDKKFLILIDATEIEIAQLTHSLTRKLDNWFIMKRKFPHWNCEECFIDDLKRIPLGMWNEVKTIAKRYNLQLKIENIEELFNKSYNEEDYKKWEIDFYKDSTNYKPRYYQTESVLKALKYQKCLLEVATSGGKTLIAFNIFRYLLDRNISKKFLYIVPNINLVTQTEEKFYEYEEMLNNKIKWKSQCVFSGAKKETKDVHIVFGTYQSLVKKDLEFFKQFDTVLIDEVHHAGNQSIKTILSKCYNAQYKIGVTGTLPKKESFNWFILQAYIGPKVYEVLPSQLISEGSATPIKIIQLELNYLEEDVKRNLFKLRSVKGEEKDGAKLLNLEKQLARDNRKRFIYICEHVKKLQKNSLVMFSDVQNDYGRKIYDWLRENTEKTIYYADGQTTADNRDYYKKQMELNDDVIIVASSGTFSEGIDIKNMGSISITESKVSHFIVNQILGRGMRLKDGKEQVIVFDFVDNYAYGSGHQQKNYLLRHGDERLKTYKERSFPVKRFKVDI